MLQKNQWCLILVIEIFIFEMVLNVFTLLNFAGVHSYAFHFNQPATTDHYLSSPRVKAFIFWYHLQMTHGMFS